MQWDFKPAHDGSLRSTAETVACRGLYQEAGFSDADIVACSKIGIHSFAWATDILDHKFFGLAITAMSRSEVEYRMENAPDPFEREPVVLFRDVRTRADCLRLLEEIRQDKDDWAPEAVYSTVRSVLVLGRIRPDDLAKVFGAR